MGETDGINVGSKVGDWLGSSDGRIVGVKVQSALFVEPKKISGGEVMTVPNQ